jgi:hypothetical protein
MKPLITRHPTPSVNATRLTVLVDSPYLRLVLLQLVHTQDSHRSRRWASLMDSDASSAALARKKGM